MSFDPYSEWLKVRSKDRPPNYYDLLGLKLEENDEEKISESYRKRYALVRKYQVGEKSAFALQIIQELSKAHDCLTSHELKKQYDKQLAKPVSQQTQAPKKQTTKKKVELEPVEVVDDEVTELKPEDIVETPVSGAIWYLITPDGMRFGPMKESDLDFQVEQGNITGDCKIWCEGWAEPKLASSIYIALDAPGSGGFELVDDAVGAPYVKQDPFGRTHSRGMTRAVGGLILAIAIAVAGVMLEIGWLWVILGMMVALSGAAALIIGWREIPLAFDAPPLTLIRARRGDAATRQTVIKTGNRLLAAGFVVLLIPTLIHVSNIVTERLSGDSEEGKSAKVPDKDGNKNEKDGKGDDVRLVDPNKPKKFLPQLPNSPGSSGSQDVAASWRKSSEFGRGAMAISVAPDAKLVAIAFSDGKIRIWNSAEDRFIQTLSPRPGPPVSDISFSPDGKQLMVASLRGISLYDVANGHAAAPVEVTDSSGTILARFGNDGSWVSTTSNSITYWKKDGTHGPRTSHPRGFADIAFRPGHSDFVVANIVQKVRYLPGVEGSEKLLPVSNAHSVAISSDGEKVAAGKADGNIDIVNPSTGETKTLKGFPGVVTQLAISPDSRTLVAAQPGGKLRFWNLSSGKFLGTTQDPSPDFKRIAFISNRTLATVGPSSVVFWEPNATQRIVRQVENITPGVVSRPPVRPANGGSDSGSSSSKVWQKAHELSASGAAAIVFEHDKDDVVIVAAGQTVKRWNLGNDEVTDLATVEQKVFQLQVSPDGTLVAAVQKNQVSLINLATGERTNLRASTPGTRIPPSISGAAFGPDNTIAVADVLKKVRIWPALAEEPKTVFDGNFAAIAAIRVHPKLPQVAVAGSGKDVSLFNIADGKKVQTVQGRTSAKSLAISDNGVIAAGFSDRKVRLWKDGNPVREIDHPRRAKLNPIQLLEFRPTSSDLVGVVVGSRMIWFWDSETGKETASLACPGAVERLSFDKSGTQLAAALKGGQFIIWKLQ